MHIGQPDHREGVNSESFRRHDTQTTRSFLLAWLLGLSVSQKSFWEKGMTSSPLPPTTHPIVGALICPAASFAFALTHICEILD